MLLWGALWAWSVWWQCLGLGVGCGWGFRGKALHRWFFVQLTVVL